MMESIFEVACCRSTTLLKKETPCQVFFCKFRGIFQSIYSVGHPRVAGFERFRIFLEVFIIIFTHKCIA